MTYTAVARYVAPIRVAAASSRRVHEHWQHLRATDRIGRWTGPARVEMRTFGIYYDDPAATPVSELRADACLAIADGCVPSGELQVREIEVGDTPSFTTSGRPRSSNIRMPVVVWHLAGTERRGAGQRADG